jgi:hypothetical protein
MRYMLAKKQDNSFQLVPSLTKKWENFFEELDLTLGHLFGYQQRTQKMLLVGLEVADWNAILLISEGCAKNRLLRRAEKLSRRFGKTVIIIQGLPKAGEYSLTFIGRDLALEPSGEQRLQFFQCRCCNSIEIVMIDNPQRPEFVAGWLGTLGHLKRGPCPNCEHINIREPEVTEKIKKAFDFAMAV